MSKVSSFTRFLSTAVVLLAFVAVGFALGKADRSLPSLENRAYATIPTPSEFIEAANSSETMSLATGQIEQGIEALFGLDHLTGDLFCWVLSPKNGDLASTYRTNVASDMGLTGDADYTLVTGLIDFDIANSGGLKVSQTVIYVGDGKSGKVLGYGLQYDAGAVRAGRTGNGTLQVVAQMLTRKPSAVRNQGR